MNQQGYIIEIVDEKTARLKMQRHSACASCGKCQTLSSETKDILVEVDNTIGAKIGDHVEVNISVEIISGLVGIVMMSTSYVILKRNDNKFRESRKFIPVITNILDR